MIYCPHCKRPSARERGNCPHCFERLDGGSSPPAAAAADGTPEAPPSGGTSFDLDDGGATLELEGDDRSWEAAVAAAPYRAPVAPAPRSAAAPDFDDRAEVLAAAGFGSPRPGPIGAVAYGLKVRSRLGALRVERAAAAREVSLAAATLTERLADLGRRAAELGLATEPGLERLVAAARLRQSGSEGIARRRAGLVEDHRLAKAALIERRDGIEQEAGPIREEEREAEAALARLENDRRRIEARVKRLRIELRNIREIIARRQQDYAAPRRTAEEKQRLLTEIAGQDRKQPAILQELGEHEAALDALAPPVTEAAARLASIRERLGAVVAGSAPIDRELRELDRRFEDDRARLAAEASGGESRAREAWSEVGTALLDGEPPAGIGDPWPPALDARTRERAAARRLDFLDRALVAYDPEVLAQAKLYGGLAAAAALALIGLAAWLAF
jgi:hypothetical protein